VPHGLIHDWIGAIFRTLACTKNSQEFQLVWQRATGLGSLPLLGFPTLQKFLAAEAAQCPGYGFQAFQADRLLTIVTDPVRPFGYRLKRAIYLCENARPSAKVDRGLLTQVHTLNLVDRIVLTLSYNDLARLRMYLAHEFPAAVLDGLLETDRLCLRHGKPP
jgi:hypothetical protein